MCRSSSAAAVHPAANCRRRMAGCISGCERAIENDPNTNVAAIRMAAGDLGYVGNEDTQKEAPRSCLVRLLCGAARVLGLKACQQLKLSESC